jgi:hypothetical protein
MIKKARYGAGENYFNVIGIINNILKTGYTEFIVSNDLFNDPFPGTGKFLEIEYNNGKKIVFPEYSCAILDGNFHKIKIFTIFTDNMIPLLELYLNSIRLSSNHHLEPIMIPCPFPGGELSSYEFKKVIDFKIENIIKSIEENMNQIIIWSDVDVIFLKNPYPLIVSKTLQYDVSYMKDNGNSLNGGFYAIKCSKETLDAWVKLKYHPKNEPLCDQPALNEILFTSNFKLNPLSDSFWCYHRQSFWNNSPPKNIFVLHATGCNKLQVLQDMAYYPM